jgi:hypothetical protein
LVPHEYTKAADLNNPPPSMQLLDGHITRSSVQLVLAGFHRALYIGQDHDQGSTTIEEEKKKATSQSSKIIDNAHTINDAVVSFAQLLIDLITIRASSSSSSLSSSGHINILTATPTTTTIDEICGLMNKLPNALQLLICGLLPHLTKSIVATITGDIKYGDDDLKFDSQWTWSAIHSYVTSLNNTWTCLTCRHQHTY